MKIGIIGGGASGMMLAALLGKNKDVTLLDGNAKLGKKLLLTGNGKCNFTAYDFNNLEVAYNNDFARNIYKKQDRDSFISFMKSIGIEPKLEYHRGLGYYYPMSNKSTSVYYALYDKIVDNGTKLIFNAKVADIKKDSDKYKVITNDNEYEFDTIVIASGGKSYTNTGSDGSMYDIIKNLGHKIIKPIPGLVGFKNDDPDLRKLKGVRVDAKAIAAVYDKGNASKQIKSFIEFGEVQFTENYVSGIPMMNLSRYVNRYIDEGYDVRIKLDLYNNCIESDKENIYEFIKDRKERLFYRNSRDFLVGMLPDEIASIILQRSCRGGYFESVSDMTENLIKNIAYNIENFTIDGISLASFDNAQVTLGGVDTAEINVETLESNIHKGLYFAGEVLDIDGRCGGYNLQLCYSTAAIVGSQCLPLH